MVIIYIKKDNVELCWEGKRPLWKMKIRRKMHNRLVTNWVQEKILRHMGRHNPYSTWDALINFGEVSLFKFRITFPFVTFTITTIYLFNLKLS